MKNIFDKFLDYLFPPDIKCIFCGDEIKSPNRFHACENCLKTLPFNNDKICKICGTKIKDEAPVCLSCFHRPPPFKLARAPFLYEAPISGIVHSLKFDNAKYLAEPLSEFMFDEYKKHNFKADLIIPIPLSEKRRKQRGYNQAGLLAENLSKKLSIPLFENLIGRMADTFPQAKLDWKDRQQNMKNVFEILDKKPLRNKNILVIDDVFTTGATIKSLCYTLKKAHPKNIYVLTLAHTYADRLHIKNQKLLDRFKHEVLLLINKKHYETFKHKNKKSLNE